MKQGKQFESPKQLLQSQTLWLAQRILERVFQKHCTAAEYVQFAPHIEKEFDRRRAELAKGKKGKR